MKRIIKHYVINTPPTEEMGSFQCMARPSIYETMHKNALWDYNSAREHDNLPPLGKMPNGTVYTTIYDD